MNSGAPASSPSLICALDITMSTCTLATSRRLLSERSTNTFEFLVMPFGLINTPTTFHALMNDILSSFLLRFVLVFFYDILIYNSTWHEHLWRVRMVFQELRRRHLVLKRSKGIFGVESVTYLGHMISAVGVGMDKQKVVAVAEWPVPQSVRAVGLF